MKRLFLDANVLFTAAHRPDGKAALIVELAREGHWRVVSSPLAAEEARRNLRRKYPEAEAGLDRLLPVVELVNAVRGVESPIPLPEKDRPILAAAISARATHLLTGDLKHFGPFMNRPGETGGVLIQTVAELLAAILS